MNVARGKEISGFAELVAVTGIVTFDGIVEAEFYVARERNWTALANLMLDLVAERQLKPPPNRSFRIKDLAVAKSLRNKEFTRKFFINQ